MSRANVEVVTALILLGALAAVAGCGSGNSGSQTATKTTPAITWATPAAIPYGAALSATQLDATANVAGTFSYSPATGTVLTAGSQTLAVTFTPTDTTDYTSATDSVTLTVNKATPTITWATPAAVEVGTVLSATQLDATSNVAGTFAYSPAAGTVLSTSGTTTLNTTFTPTDTGDYNTATASVSIEVSSTPSTATVDFGAEEQTIRGFGASEAWYGTMPSSEISALYGTGSGDLGLSIMRLRIAPATWTSATKTADTTQWTTELGNAKAAKALGATIFASPWSPPPSMKTNDSVNEGSLSTTSYADFANYLEAYVNYATGQGVSLYAISMQNEPDWNPCDPNGTDEGPNGKDCYESCLWTAAQMDTWVAQNASVLTTRLIMPESYYFASSISDPALDDPSALGNISIVGGHVYGAAPYYYANAESKGKDVWMTEHYLSAASGTTTTSIADAITLAEEIHNSMTVADYNAYVYWWPVDGSTGAAAGLVDTSYNPNYFGYAMAQFALFVRPGYVRVNATASPSTGVYISAYSGNGHSVIVAINSTTSASLIQFNIQNQAVTTLMPYQTTAGGGLAALSPISVSNNTFTTGLPAQSITTFVQ